MTIVINKNTTREELEKLVRSLQEVKKGVDTFKFCGAVKFPMDGLTLQKKWRDEWD